MKKCNFSFRVSLENIKRFKDLPVETKLDWLRKANEFIRCVVPKSRLKNWEKYFRGK